MPDPSITISNETSIDHLRTLSSAEEKSILTTEEPVTLHKEDVDAKHTTTPPEKKEEEKAEVRSVLLGIFLKNAGDQKESVEKIFESTIPKNGPIDSTHISTFFGETAKLENDPFAEKKTEVEVKSEVKTEAVEQSKPEPKGDIQSVKSFLKLFRSWPDNTNMKTLNRFMLGIKKNTSDMLSYMKHAKGDAIQEIKQAIYTESNDGWGWSAGIKDFKVEVDWDYSGDDLTKTPWSTLNTIIDEMASNLNELEEGTPEHQVYTELCALLLSTILPTYFVKAANIDTIVDRLQEKLPSLVFKVSGDQANYSPAENPPNRHKDLPNKVDDKHDSCRGFQVKQIGDRCVLMLTYNPTQEMIHPDNLALQEKNIEELTERLTAEKK